eukprot:sb/3474743/
MFRVCEGRVFLVELYLDQNAEFLRQPTRNRIKFGHPLVSGPQNTTSRAFERYLEHLSTPSNCRDLNTPYFDCFSRGSNFHSKNIYGYGYGLMVYSTKTRSFYVSRPETGLNLATRWSKGLKICPNMFKLSFGVI